jgi:autotransporter-associated beta strand protein
MLNTMTRGLAPAIVLSLLASTALASPQGAGPFIVPVPEVQSPLPVVDNYKAQAGVDSSGAKINKYDPTKNPVIAILSGFDDIWTLGDDAWRAGGANGDGPSDFSHARIVDKKVWAANMAYVLQVTGNRDAYAARRAFLDEMREQNVSVLDGLGPLEAAYIANSGASTSIDLGVDPMKEQAHKAEDEGNSAGFEESKLGDFVRFIEKMRGPEGTTSPAKYFYTSPRPWRMNDKGEVVVTGKQQIAGKESDAYDSNVQIVPALLINRDPRGLRKDGAFPSGHTNAGYLSAFAYAYAVPERFAEMMTRASQLGEDRVIAGMHSPLDVIGGRIMATALAAAYLNDPALADIKKAAYDNMHEVFSTQLRQGQSLMQFAHSGQNDAWGDAETNKAAYHFRLTYGLPQDPAKAGKAMVVPKGAEALLETRLPYLSADQRRVVLYTTGIDSGYPLLDASNGWGRIDLVAAADGYGAFPGDVDVAMDAAKGGFDAADSWSNDISGPGMLTKEGSGALTLSGNNSYKGGTILKAGTLVAASSQALGTGDTLIEGGTLRVTAGGLDLAGLEVKAGTLEVDLSGATEGTIVPVIRAAALKGSFPAVTDLKGGKLEYTVEGGTLSVKVPAKAS